MDPVLDETLVDQEQISWQDRISKHSLLILFFLLLIIGSGIYFGLSISGNQYSGTQIQHQSQKITTLNLAPYTFVYGVWDGNSSVIKALDLHSGDFYQLASLPFNIKKAFVISSNSLLYINNTNSNDYGTEISLYSIKYKKSVSLVKASNGYRIDDYVLSPNREYLAYWEVIASSSGTLLGGKSRVYTVALKNPTIKHLIYAETANSPVHYPRAILDNGMVYCDTFLPNSGAGWAYGISESSFTGSSKIDLSNMTNGTYGSQPILSPDGTYLLFTGYDGTKGVGTSTINGFRRSIADANTLELLDTTNNQRIMLPGISHAHTYISATWTNNNNMIIYSQIASNPTADKQYSYNIDTHLRTPLPALNNQTVLGSLGQNRYLTGVQSSSQSNFGDLGNAYLPLLSQVNVYDALHNTSTQLRLPDSSVQFISLEPSNFFSKSVQVTNSGKVGNAQLQLNDFTLKQTLITQRLKNQSNPQTSGSTNGPCLNTTCTTRQPCTDVIGQQALGQCWDGNESHQANQSCLEQAQINAGVPATTVCAYKPVIYLYPQSPRTVSVHLHIPGKILVSIPYYPKAGWTDILANPDGSLRYHGQWYHELFYESQVPMPNKPEYGIIVPVKDISTALKLISLHLGFNSAESKELTSFWTTKLSSIHSPYIFISYLSQTAKQSIDQVTIQPQPETFIQYMLYFKPVETTYYVPAPHYPTIVPRKGFTAVEWGGVIDYTK